MNFGIKAGLDMQKVIETISKGAAGSGKWKTAQKQCVRMSMILVFAVNWMKDLGIALQEAQKNGARLPVAALVDQFYAAVQNRGGEKWIPQVL